MTSDAIARRETADALRTVRELWGELLLAIETPPADVWPPRQLAHTLRAADDKQLVADRAPLVLREHPAPLNMTALDTGLAIERMLFGLADTLAAAVQRAEADDPRRWEFQQPGAADARHAAGSRAHGLHFASVWIEGRVLDEDTAPEQQLDGTPTAPPFEPLPPHLLHEARRTVRVAEGRIAADPRPRPAHHARTRPAVPLVRRRAHPAHRPGRGAEGDLLDRRRLHGSRAVRRPRAARVGVE